MRLQKVVSDLIGVGGWMRRVLVVVARLLVNYGFAIDNNPDDMIPLSFSLPLADPDSSHGQLQRILLDAAGITSLPHVIKFSAQDRKSQSLTAEQAEQHSSVSRFVVGAPPGSNDKPPDQMSGSEVPVDLMNLARLATYSESDMRAVAERLPATPSLGSPGSTKRGEGGLSNDSDRSALAQSLFLSPSKDDKVKPVVPPLNSCALKTVVCWLNFIHSCNDDCRQPAKRGSGLNGLQEPCCHTLTTATYPLQSILR